MFTVETIGRYKKATKKLLESHNPGITTTNMSSLYTYINMQIYLYVPKIGSVVFYLFIA